MEKQSKKESLRRYIKYAKIAAVIGVATGFIFNSWYYVVIGCAWLILFLLGAYPALFSTYKTYIGIHVLLLLVAIILLFTPYDYVASKLIIICAIAMSFFAYLLYDALQPWNEYKSTTSFLQTFYTHEQHDRYTSFWKFFDGIYYPDCREEAKLMWKIII